MTDGDAPPQAPKSADGQPPARPRVVAIGAAAGGLDALGRFFSALDGAPNAAFVVIEFLALEHESMMRDLLARHTTMPIHVADNGQRLAPGEVFVLPPGHNLTIKDGRLALLEKPEHGLNLPIDIFFTAAAAACGDRLVAVVLSGKGSDGTRGAAAVTDAGGVLLAQSPETATFDSMPRSVIYSGVVDATLPPEALAARVAALVARDGSAGAERPKGDEQPAPLDDASDPYGGIVRALSSHSRIDFDCYKRGTTLRRVQRRMLVRHVTTPAAYLEVLRTDERELDTLRREVLIGVTSFFRDAEAFAALAKHAIDPIVADAPADDGIRVWVAGCSTGEEAYSIAMLFEEAFERHGARKPLKIFATDVEPTHLEFAQTGSYPAAVIAEIGEDRSERFFRRRGERLVVNEEIRRNIIFARHDLTLDPPFTRMDLVTCRNTLIYFEASAQERVLRRFQYALGPGRWLFLGSSESLGSVAGAFETMDAKGKVFRCLRAATLPLDLGRGPLGARAVQGSHQQRRLQEELDSARELLAAAYLPPTILVQEDRALVHVFSGASALLRVPLGGATLDFTRLLAPRLATVAVSVLLRALKSEEPVRASAGDAGGHLGPVVIEGRCVRRGGGRASLVLISFLEHAAEKVGDARDFDAKGESAARIRELETEVSSTRENLQATIEELEATNEELQAANEELIAGNEELQSTNEELQSVNEELQSVNAEHHDKIGALRRLNADLNVMSRATRIPMLFLDSELRVVRFTPTFVELVPLSETDVGRPLAHFTTRFDAPWLLAELRRVLESAEPFEREIRTDDGRAFLLRAVHYAIGGKREPAVVVTILDVSSLATAQRMQDVLDALTDRLSVVDADGNVEMVNDAWKRLVRRGGDPHLLRAGPGVALAAALRADDTPIEQAGSAALADALDTCLAADDAQDGGRRPVHMEVRVDEGPRRDRVVTAVVAPLPGGGALVTLADPNGTKGTNG